MSEQVMQLLNEVDSDLTWFKDNFEKLKHSYNEMFVAIKDGRVLAAGKDLDKIINELKKNKMDSGDVIIQFVSSIPAIF